MTRLRIDNFAVKLITLIFGILNEGSYSKYVGDIAISTILLS